MCSAHIISTQCATCHCLCTTHSSNQGHIYGQLAWANCYVLNTTTTQANSDTLIVQTFIPPYLQIHSKDLHSTLSHIVVDRFMCVATLSHAQCFSEITTLYKYKTAIHILNILRDLSKAHLTLLQENTAVIHRLLGLQTWDLSDSTSIQDNNQTLHNSVKKSASCKLIQQ